jgi:leader peptidase (prepilin peptidase) / N-methyltransferase
MGPHPRLRGLLVNRSSTVFGSSMGTVFEVGAALLGACVGSFLNVVIWRLQQEDPRRRSLGGRSHCPHCGALIRWFDNVPVLSWLLLRARARCCGGRIAVRYPTVELLTAGLFWLLAAWPPFGSVVVAVPGGEAIDLTAAAAFALHALFLSFLVALSFIDFDTQLLPDVMTKPGMAIGLLAGLWPGLAGVLSTDPSTSIALRSLLASLAGLLVGGGVTWLIRAVGSAVFRREAMGFGDVKLMGMIGAFLGWQAALLTMFLGCVFGAVLGSVGALAGRGTVIPFGPFLAIGAVVAMFARGPILHFLFTTWPEWQRSNPTAPMWLAGFAVLSLFALFVLVRRGRRSG